MATMINDMHSADLSARAARLIALFGFSGSYSPEDITFLLQQVQVDNTPPEEKERLIQSGQKHYSQMISEEKAPSAQHIELYEQALAQGGLRMATEVQMLAQRLVDEFAEPVILVSFVRAGVPLGVLLKHAIEDLGVQCQHYGISIVRDRGIDHAALETIIARHSYESLVFVDGWTGKGAISQELQRSLGDDPRFQSCERGCLPLVTLADIGGHSWLAASGEDWLIPSGVLGSTVSGLISRSVCLHEPPQADDIGADNLHQWHGCMVYQHLQDNDLSARFIQQLNQLRRGLTQVANASWSSEQRQQQRTQASKVISQLAAEYQVSNLNRIKPGIAEATRAILRRVPEVVLLRDEHDPDTVLLRYLTQKTGTPVKIVGDAIAPYRAVTLIQNKGAA